MAQSVSKSTQCPARRGSGSRRDREGFGRVLVAATARCHIPGEELCPQPGLHLPLAAAELSQPPGHAGGTARGRDRAGATPLGSSSLTPRGFHPWKCSGQAGGSSEQAALLEVSLPMAEHGTSWALSPLPAQTMLAVDGSVQCPCCSSSLGTPGRRGTASSQCSGAPEPAGMGLRAAG